MRHFETKTLKRQLQGDKNRGMQSRVRSSQRVHSSRGCAWYRRISPLDLILSGGVVQTFR